MDSNYTVEVDKVNAPQWDALLARFDDASIYQTWAYGAVSWGERQLSHLVLKRKGEVVAIAQLRLVLVPVLGKGVAYLRWGPLWRLRGKAIESEVVEQTTRALIQEYVQRRGLLLRLVSNSFRNDPAVEMIEGVWSRHGLKNDSIVPPYRTLRLDLTPPLDVLRKNFEQKWRNVLNGAERNELTLAEGTGDDLYQEFLGVYHEMMARKAFETSVDVNEFARLQQALPEPLKMRIIMCRKDGRTLNALVAGIAGDTGIYLLGATSDEGTKLKGSYLAHWRMIQWMKERGIRWYDLGGINPERNPGVYKFKKGFSGEDVSLLGTYEVCQNPISKLVVNGGEKFSKWLKAMKHREPKKEATEAEPTAPTPAPPPTTTENKPQT